MNLKIQLSAAFLISFVALIGFSLMAFLVSFNHISQFDNVIISFITGFESPNLTVIMKFFTTIGSSIYIAVILLLISFFLYKICKHRSELILLVSVMIGANFLFASLKLLFHRERPDLHRLIEIGGYSFPSGHATNAFALYGILTYLLWRHIPSRFGRTILIIFSSVMIIMIGVSRIYLGVHYPSDVIAGYFISGFWLTVAISFFRRYKRKKESKI
ncbi:MAG TPA: phosphatase PAP2 family protein [Bacillus bacterium]|nr:phosphatase PAP2 family protein [Bacillus sp. (in: firmicutes)]